MTRKKATHITTRVKERSSLQGRAPSGMIIAGSDTIDGNYFRAQIEAFGDVIKNVLFLSP